MATSLGDEFALGVGATRGSDALLKVGVIE